MLETVLERIAVALEKQNAMTEQLLAGKASVVQAPPAQVVVPKKETKAPKAAPVVQIAPVVEVDPFSNDTEPSAITLDSLMAHLTTHAKAFGNKTTIDLIKKHGADAATPKIKTIPEANWQACWDEVTADLNKIKK